MRAIPGAEAFFQPAFHVGKASGKPLCIERPQHLESTGRKRIPARIGKRQHFLVLVHQAKRIRARSSIHRLPLSHKQKKGARGRGHGQQAQEHARRLRNGAGAQQRRYLGALAKSLENKGNGSRSEQSHFHRSPLSA
ncbi:hypothetical protein [Slackia faecicanis]|uniref:hypothetical protein n=1 Tax=Slackia faecicanis TaxID=255723 RepID=UPI0011CE29EB|nr:hypothetical protein [Slackia faecicanis]